MPDRQLRTHHVASININRIKYSEGTVGEKNTFIVDGDTLRYTGKIVSSPTGTDMVAMNLVNGPVAKPPTPFVVRGIVHLKVITKDEIIITSKYLVDTDVVGNKITGAGFTKIPGYHLVKIEGNPDGKEYYGDVTIKLMNSERNKLISGLK